MVNAAKGKGAEREVEGVLLDLDGVFYVEDALIPGAVEALALLDERRIPYCFITNTTTQSSRQLSEKLAGLGIPCRREQLITAPVATADYLRRREVTRCFFAVDDAVMEDFDGTEAVEHQAQAVVVGDIGERWNYELLDNLFQHLLNGAELVAMHRNKYWQKTGGLHIDIGAFVAGLEYVADIAAVTTGKPSASFFRAALDYLGVDREAVLLVGDDIESDIGGARDAGVRGALVQTGKYREALAAKSEVKPDWVIPSIAELGRCLG